MGSYVSLVRPRWSDMDMFGHVNHARTVTLLEEARLPILYTEARAAGLLELTKGIVVAQLDVRYLIPIVVRDQQLRVEISLQELRFASFRLGYRMHTGPDEDDPVAVTAQTQLVPYDVAGNQLRRLSDAERDFLRRITGEQTSEDAGTAGAAEWGGAHA